jgi:hypothetical protein
MLRVISCRAVPEERAVAALACRPRFRPPPSPLPLGIASPPPPPPPPPPPLQLQPTSPLACVVVDAAAVIVVVVVAILKEGLASSSAHTTSGRVTCDVCRVTSNDWAQLVPQLLVTRSPEPLTHLRLLSPRRRCKRSKALAHPLAWVLVPGLLAALSCEAGKPVRQHAALHDLPELGTSRILHKQQTTITWPLV